MPGIINHITYLCIIVICSNALVISTFVSKKYHVIVNASIEDIIVAAFVSGIATRIATAFVL